MSGHGVSPPQRHDIRGPVLGLLDPLRSIQLGMECILPQGTASSLCGSSIDSGDTQQAEFQVQKVEYLRSYYLSMLVTILVVLNTSDSLIIQQSDTDSHLQNKKTSRYAYIFGSTTSNGWRGLRLFTSTIPVSVRLFPRLAFPPVLHLRQSLTETLSSNLIRPSKKQSHTDTNGGNHH